MPHRVFVVDDHPVLLNAYSQLLAAEPDLLLAGTARTAEEALTTLKTAECDLVVADDRLPDMCGAVLTRRLQSSRPSLPVVVVSDTYGATGPWSGPAVHEAMDAGAAAFLTKGALGRDLAQTVRGVLDGAHPAPLSVGG